MPSLKGNTYIPLCAFSLSISILPAETREWPTADERLPQLQVVSCQMHLIIFSLHQSCKGQLHAHTGLRWSHNHVQAARERQSDSESRPPKRPTFKRPTAKRPATALGLLPEGPPAQRPRTAAPVSSTSRQEAVHPRHTSPPVPSAQASPAWSPSQDQPYSPGKASCIALRGKPDVQSPHQLQDGSHMIRMISQSIRQLRYSCAYRHRTGLTWFNGP